MIIFSIVVTASVMFFSNPFVRYFQPLIFYGILKTREFFSFNLNLGIIKGKISVDNHIVTFILSIFAVALAYLVIILIFDPFYSTRNKGTGLGLSIVHNITKMHGGGIDITSCQAEGTECIVTLPLCENKKKT